jgi:electron transfer flavoprotein beta subunit
MNLVVCLKQVPQQNSVRIAADHAVDASGIEPIISLFDEYAIEEALLWGERLGANVTVLSIGDPGWSDSMRRALAMGANDAMLIHDAACAELDAHATAQVAAAAIRRIGDVGLVFCGRNSTDDETGAFVPALARALGWAQATYVGAIQHLDAATAQVERHLEDEVEQLEVQLPAVLSVVKGINEPRYPSLVRIRRVARAPIPTLTLAELGIAPPTPATRVVRRVPPAARPASELLAGDAATQVRTLVDRLRDAQVL